ncbi:hypothetical protein RM553_07565 [Zunongwangia sp. F363]|uniref:Lipoprotein n=1 Tax=Autumnicola tepida TaxID=3075595 RepID=A0ABU3C8N8_9FLAO|nr:hypothetical protein [Zunongwangia sp. F363]MDT0642689.1 hypothetical protein [Zunongwangia sp. F363]
MIKRLLLILVILLQWSCIVTHRVEDMEHSKLVLPESENGQSEFKFQSKLRKEKTRQWLRNYLGLPAKDDLVLSEVKLFPDIDYTFWISVNLSHDREKSIYLHEVFDADQEAETHEGPIKFFVSIWVTDALGEDHLSNNSIFKEKVYQYLLEMEKEFEAFSEESPDHNFFNG